MGKKSIRILFFIVVVAFFAGVVTSERSWAQETDKSTPAKGEDGWRFLIAPYFWMGGIQGTAEGKRGKTENINVTVGDAFDLINNIDFIIGGRIEIAKGRWGFIFDGFGETLSDFDDFSRIRKTRFPILVPPTVTITGGVDIKMELSIVQAAFSYDGYRSTKFVGKRPELTIQAMAGARYTYLYSRVEFAAAGPLIGVQRTIDWSQNWIDPIIGGRLLWNLHKS